MVFEKTFHELSVLCEMELVLFTVLAGAALRTKKDSEGFVYGNKHRKVNNVQIQGDGKSHS